MSPAREARHRKPRVRRAPHLVAYWRGRSLVVCNYATSETVEVTPLICEILDVCSSWKTIEEIRRAVAPGASHAFSRLVRRLVARSLLELSDRPQDSRVRDMARLDRWNPEAGFFHTSTRDVQFASPRRAARQARIQAVRSPMPPPVKRYRGAAPIALPRPAGEGEFARVLRARRTFRRYSPAAVTIDELATLLGFTAGVQHWVQAGSRKVPLKTSPSGGARHPIECYVAVRHVSGLRAGIYHYAADRHLLERLRGPVSVERLQAYVPNSGYFARASALVFFTAVFERILWRYPYSRAYRAALVEAGHVCQTFCLTATWQGLAPFSVMGLADSLIERDLGIDGIGESVLYAAGVGRPPARTPWAPLVRGHLQILRNPYL